MAKKKEAEFSLPALDDLFSSQAQRDEQKYNRIVEIPISEIDNFEGHPFKVEDDDAMMLLAESIEKYGQIEPGKVRKKEDGRYELIAGHRRKRGCELAGMKTLKAEVLDVTHDEAIIIMVDSNMHRPKILPSEKAFSYRMKLEAMNRQGERNDLTFSPTGKKSNGKNSAKEFADKMGESKNQVYRYIRLTYLIQGLIHLVDDGRVGLQPAVEISYIPTELQSSLLNAIEMEDCSPSLSQTKQIRSLFDDGILTEESIIAIVQQEKPNQKEKIVLQDYKVRKYIPKSIPIPKREEYIIKALEHYAKYIAKQEQMVSR